MKHGVKTGTTAGTLVSLIGTILWTDIEKTLVLAAIGATVSFLVSFGLKVLFEKNSQVKKSSE